MAGPSRLGFRRGRSYHNVILAAMYLSVFVVIVGVVIATVIMPALSSGAQPAENDGGAAATNTPTATATATSSQTSQPTPQQTQPSSQSTPDPSSNPITEDTSQTPISDKRAIQTYREVVNDNTSITFVSTERHGDTFYVKYIPNNMSKQNLMDETGYLVGAFGGAVRVWDVKTLNATILNKNHKPIATYHAESQWLMKYQRGEFDAGQVTNRTLATVNSTSSNTTIPMG